MILPHVDKFHGRSLDRFPRIISFAEDKRQNELSGTGVYNEAYSRLIFRHTAATSWLENCGNVEDLRSILGQSKYDMVKRYAHVSNSSVNNSAEQYSVVTRIGEI